MKVKVATSPTQTEFEEVDLTLTTRRGTECLIGRSPDSDLVLDSDDVSRLHGKFFSQGGHYYFCDVGSRNGSIVNGKLAEKNHSYVLKNGDIIRIGDFTLMLEDEMPDSQQAETVVRIINPSVFSNWRPQNENVAAQESVSSQIPAAVSPPYEELEKQEIVNTSTEVEKVKQVEDESTFIQPEGIITPDSAIGSQDESNEVSDDDKPTVVQLNDVNQHEVATNVEHQTENVVNTEDDLQVPDLSNEYTVVQPHDVVNQDHDAVTNTEHQTEDVASTEHDLQAPDSNHEYTVVQAHDLVSQDHDAVEHQTEDVANTEHDLQAPDLSNEYTVVQAHDVVSQDISQDHDAATNIEHQTEDVASTEHEEEIAAHTHNEHETEEAISSDSENVDLDTPSQQVEEELVPELVSADASISTQSLSSEDVATSHSEELELESAESEESFVQVAKILEEKQIVLVSHDSKKSELTELVAEHDEFLSLCLTRTWQTFSDDLYKQTGLSVTQEIPPANSGGYQAINSLVNSGDILSVIFLRDLITPQKNQASEEALLRICNINNVLLATNLPTAKAVLHYLKNLKD